MKLLKYTYRLIDSPRFDNWVMDEIDLQDLNLVVGKNASGKSRVLNILMTFSEMLTQYKPVQVGNWEFTFLTRDEKTVFYRVTSPRKTEIKEELFVDERVVLERNNGLTRLYSETKKTFENISPPDDKLVLHVRRDKAEYPFLEELVEWAEHTHGFGFGQIHPNVFSSSERIEKKNLTVEDIPALLEQLDEDFKQRILEDFNTLGYAVENLYARPEGEKDVLYIKEKGLRHDLKQQSLSQGMFRSLSLLVFIQYLIKNTLVQTIIVDDLCEGLDYDRATKLGTLLFEILRGQKIQFIASSNESFLMDVVNIKYWNILIREETRIKVYNYKNSHEQFERFKYSGLSNFDLFSSDYLA